MAPQRSTKTSFPLEQWKYTWVMFSLLQMTLAFASRVRTANALNIEQAFPKFVGAHLVGKSLSAVLLDAAASQLS
jgi:hypothetical protein